MDNKHIWTQDEFYELGSLSKLPVGELVEQAIVDDFMDCLPPVTMTSRCSQLGEAYSTRIDPDSGKYRNTYHTFTRVSSGVWRYCGDCFAGEIEQRGASIPRV